MQHRREGLNLRQELGRLAAILLVGALGTVPLVADTCVNINTHSNGLYIHTRCGVPDLDQVRVNIPPFNTGLPGDGWNYCGPTSMMNWFVYIANHGMPAFAPGAGDYGPEACTGAGDCPQYNKISEALRQLGKMMHTSVKTGTSGHGMVEGGLAYLEQNGLGGQVSITRWSAQHGARAPFRSMARAAVLGKLVIPVIGRYSKWEDLTKKQQTDITNYYGDDDTSGLWRVGGHMVSLNSAHSQVQLPTRTLDWLGFMDPASPQDVGTRQSDFTYSGSYTEDVNQRFNDDTMTLSKLLDVDAYFDGYDALAPSFTLTTVGMTAYYYSALDFNSVERAGRLQQFTSATGGRITEIAIEPHDYLHTYLSSESEAILQLDTLTGQSSRLAVVPGAKKLVYGDSDETLFVMTPYEVLGLSQSGEVKRRGMTRTPLDGIAWDFQNMRLVGISLAAQKIYAFGPRLETVREASLHTPLCTTSYHFKYNPKAGTFAGLCDGAVRVSLFDWRGEAVQQRDAALEGMRSAVGLAFNDAGSLFVSDGGLLREFDSALRFVPNGMFARVPANGPLDMLRSFQSYNPRMEGTFQEDNVLPPWVAAGGEVGR